MLADNARAREEAERRIAAQNRRMDHLERARREEETPLLEKAFQAKVLLISGMSNSMLPSTLHGRMFQGGCYVAG